uniref:Uncharacterized protein n=1 Tax=Myoviridae sp. ctNQV2 TaxID=2827683 RepID=A0A8S5RZ61_9CAUD|nr:MAG TPA: hypothetical protein [Myoviridae sp. ctNQV2]
MKKGVLIKKYFLFAFINTKYLVRIDKCTIFVISK